MTPKRLQAVREWLAQNPDDNAGRIKFLDVVMTLPFTDPLREEFLGDTRLWLEQHPNNDNVRAKFLDVLRALPSTNRLRKEFVETTSVWLEQHPDNHNVRAKFLNIVGDLPPQDTLRQAVLAHTARWLEDRPHDTVVRLMFLTIAGSTDVGFDTLVRSAALLDNQRRKSWQTVADAMVQPYLRAAQSEKWKRDKRLRAIRDSILGWYQAVGATPPDLDAKPKLEPNPSRPVTRGFNTLADAFRRAFGNSDGE
jgi:hypothetical protein